MKQAPLEARNETTANPCVAPAPSARKEAGNMPGSITGTTFETEVLQGTRPVLADFRPPWRAPPDGGHHPLWGAARHYRKDT